MLQAFLMGVLSMRATSGPPPSAPSLDAYTTGMFSVCSLFKLLSAYTGHAIQVRRSSDNSLANIDFMVDGTLDTATLASFVGSNSAYIQTIYDQSGHGNHFYQATNSLQPRIINAGTYDGIIVFDGTDDFMQCVNNNNNPTGISAYIRGTLRSTSAKQMILTSDLVGGADSSHGSFLMDYETTFHGFRNVMQSNLGGNGVANECTGATFSNNTNAIVGDFTTSTNANRVPYFVNGTRQAPSISAAGTIPTTTVLSTGKWQVGYGPIGVTNYAAQLSAASIVIYEVAHSDTTVANISAIVDHYH